MQGSDKLDTATFYAKYVACDKLTSAMCHPQMVSLNGTT